jgi:hypothetical protein
LHSSKAGSSVDWVARADALRIQVHNFVGGKVLAGDSAGLLHKSSPRDGHELYSFAAGSRRDVDSAVAVARRAFVDEHDKGVSVVDPDARLSTHGSLLGL